MRFGWILWLCTGVVWAVDGLQPPLANTSAPGLQPGPKPFPAKHYEVLQEYSPFVKSMEAAKETEKSPDLVVVGYGRIRGEDQVIVQRKDMTEKREKIGSRYGSTNFPYRLLSVTNVGNRKTFVAILEDQKNKPIKVQYAADSPPQTTNAATAGGGAAESSSSNQNSGSKNQKNQSTQQNVQVGSGLSPEDEIKDIKAKIDNGELVGEQKERALKRIEALGKQSKDQQKQDEPAVDIDAQAVGSQTVP